MSLLKIYNEESLDREVGFVNAPLPDFEGGDSRSYLTNQQIIGVLSEGEAYSTTNKLVLTITPSEDETSGEVFNIDNTHGVISVVRLYFKDIVPSPTGLEKDCYSQSVTGDLLISASPYRIELELTFTDIVKDIFDRKDIPIPDFGFMSVAINKRVWNNVTNEFEGGNIIQNILVKVTLDPIVRPLEVAEVLPIRDQAIYVENWFTSKPFSYENLHVPCITGSFVYNFYQIDENSLLAAKRKNYNLQKVSKIPKYIELNWTTAPISVTSIPEYNDLIGNNQQEGGNNQANPQGLQPNAFDPEPAGGRFQVERAARNGNAFRFGGIGGGAIFGIGGFAQEQGALFGGLAGAGRLARGMSRADAVNGGAAGVQQNINIDDGVGPDLIIGNDTAIGLGLSAQEDLILQDMVRNTNQPDAISGPNEFSRYIGYVLFKERYNETLDQYEPVDLLAVLDRRKTRIIDTKVSYGDTYRYKIRSVFKFINAGNLPLFGDQDSILSRSVISTFDGGIPFKNAFYFDSKFSEPIEVTCLEYHRPDAPFNFQIFPNSKKKEIFLTWNQKDPDKDVAGFNVFRKLDIIGSVFERINTIPLSNRNNFFVDNLIEFDTKYIYAIQTVDVHDNFSKLSIQLKASIRSQDFWTGRIENEIEVHVNRELELDSPNSPPKKSEVIKFNKDINLIINPLFGNLDREATYLLKVKSLDTFFEKEVKLNFRTKIIMHRSILPSDAKFAERQAQLRKEFEEAERKRFGLTIEEAQQRKDGITPGRDDFDE